MPKITAIDIDDLDTQIMLARALRNSFCDTQSQLLKGAWMSDEMIVENVREMQEQYAAFDKLTSSIKLLNEDAYNSSILGMSKD